MAEPTPFGMKMTWVLPSNASSADLDAPPVQAPSLDFKALLPVKKKKFGAQREQEWNQQSQQRDSGGGASGEAHVDPLAALESSSSSSFEAIDTSTESGGIIHFPSRSTTLTPGMLVSPLGSESTLQSTQSPSPHNKSASPKYETKTTVTTTTASKPIAIVAPSACDPLDSSNVSPSSTLRVSVYGPPQARRAPSSQRGTSNTPTTTGMMMATTSNSSFNDSTAVSPGGFGNSSLPSLQGPAVTTPTMTIPRPLDIGPASSAFHAAESSSPPSPSSRSALHGARRSGLHSLIVVFVGTIEFERTLLAQKLARYLSWIGFAAKMFTAVDSTAKAVDPDDVEAVRYSKDSEQFLSSAETLWVPPTLWGQTLDECVFAVTHFLTTTENESSSGGKTAPTTGDGVSPPPAAGSGAIDARVALVNGEFPTDASRALAEEIFSRQNPHADLMFVDLSPLLPSTEQPGSAPLTASAIKRRGQPAMEDEVPYVPVQSEAPPKGDVAPHRRMVFAFHEQGSTTLRNITGWLPSKVAFALMNFTPCLRRTERAELDEDASSCASPEATPSAGGDKKKKRKKMMHPMVPIFFTRHGQSEYNLQDRLGGNPSLTEKGREDAACIGQFMKHEVLDNKSLLRCFEDVSIWEKIEGFQIGSGIVGSPASTATPFDQFESSSSITSGQLLSAAKFHQLSQCTQRMLRHTEVWTSQLKRTQETAQPTVDLGVPRRMWAPLNEIHAGICEDLTNKEVNGIFPEIQKFRSKDKFSYRYPHGESYQDLMHRLEPIIVELETSSKCILVVGHQAILRTLLSYFAGVDVEHAVQAAAPQRTVWCCCFTPSGTPKLIQIALEKSVAEPETTADTKPKQADAPMDSLSPLQSSPNKPQHEWSGW